MGVRRPNGEQRWIWVTAAPTGTDQRGRPTGVVATFADISTQHDVVEELTSVRATLEAVTDNLPDIVVRLDRDGTVEWVSPSMERVLGLRQEEVLGTSDAYLAPGSRAEVAATLARALVERAIEQRFSASLRRADGGEVPADATCRLAYDDEGRPTFSVVTYRDVTRRLEGERRLAESEERYRLLAENSSDVVMVIQSGRVQWVSPSLSEALGWAPDEWTGTPAADYLHPEDLETILAHRDDLVAGRSVMSRRRVRDRAGIYHWVESHSRAFRYDDGTVNGVQTAFRLIDTEVATEQELLHRAQHDALTGLLTTTELRDRLATVLWGRRAADSSVAVLFCDLDDFKAVNDAHGHATGDLVLRAVAGRITEVVRDDDLVGRMGGDEMAVVLVGVATVDEATTIADGIRAAVRRAVPDLEPESPTASVGVALARPGDTVDGCSRAPTWRCTRRRSRARTASPSRPDLAG